MASTPKTRLAFWEEKFNANILRDQRNVEALTAMGWRVAIIWECRTRKPDLLQTTLKEAVPLQPDSSGDRAEFLDRRRTH
jgi:DNA mismatch endonuclease, patch repair protein